LGEFYGELGTFDVILNIPDSFIVAATGEVIPGDHRLKSVEIDSSDNLKSQPDLISLSSNDIDCPSSVNKLSFMLKKFVILIGLPLRIICINRGPGKIYRFIFYFKRHQTRNGIILR
jgi:hypothetical protein